MSIEPIAQSGAKGYFSDREQRIVLRSGMSEVQTVKTLMHEIAHAVLHNAERLQETGKKTRGQKEVEAESVAYVVCRHFGIDVSDYSFGYVAGWSRSKSCENCMRRSTPSAKLPRRSLMQLRYPRESMSESKKYIAIKEKQDGTHERNRDFRYPCTFYGEADRP